MEGGKELEVGAGVEAAKWDARRECVRWGMSLEQLDALWGWVHAQPHLPAAHLTDTDLVLAYWSCHGSLELAKQLLDLHFSLRTLYVQLFANRALDTATERAFRTMLFCALAEPAVDGSRVIYNRLMDYEPKKFVFCDGIRAFLMVVDAWQRLEGPWPGFVILIDLEHVTLAHLARLDPSTLHQAFYFLQEAMLVRLRGLHFLNAPSFMDRVLALLRPFMKRALQDMVHVHQPGAGASTLHAHVPRCALPKDMGGDHVSFQEAQARVWASMQQQRAYWAAEGARRVQERLRPRAQPPPPPGALALAPAPHGSFRALSFD